MHDSWLEGLSKRDMKRAREAQEKRDQERRQKAAEDDIVLTSDLLSTLILRLDKGETVLEALQRVGAGGKKKKTVPKWKKNKKSNGDAMDVDGAADGHAEEEDPAEKKRREAVEEITGAADKLFSRDQLEIYDQEREVLMRQYKRETGEDWVQPEQVVGDGPAGTEEQAKMWEYRWSDARDGGESHGPYDGPTMQAWNEAGYFGEGVEFRSIGQEAWSRAVDFV